MPMKINQFCCLFLCLMNKNTSMSILVSLVLAVPDMSRSSEEGLGQTFLFGKFLHIVAKQKCEKTRPTPTMKECLT